jgi:hypothetical protein
MNEIVDTFLDHVRYLRIKHHVPGRIRVKATWNGAKKLVNSADADIEKILARIPGVSDYRVNPRALSVIISYDPNILPFQLWEEIGQLGEYPANRSKVREELLALVDKTAEEA